MVVGAIGKLSRDRGEVILGVVGEVIFTFGPLADVSIVAGAHDRPPGRFAGAVPAVIFRAVGFAVVSQAEVMADLMRGGFGGKRFLAAEIVVVNPGGAIARGAAAAEDADVSDAARIRRWIVRAVGVGMAGDQGVRGPAGEGGGPFGGHIHIERGVIFRDALP